MLQYDISKACISKARYDTASLKPVTIRHLESPFRYGTSKSPLLHGNIFTKFYKAQILIWHYFTKLKCYFGYYFIKPKCYFGTYLQSPNINLALFHKSPNINLALFHKIPNTNLALFHKIPNAVLVHTYKTQMLF